MPLPIPKHVPVNQTKYQDFDPRLANQIRILIHKFGTMGPVSQRREPKRIRKPRVRRRTQGSIQRVSPTSWTSYQNGIPITEEFAIRHPITGKLMDYATYRRSALSVGGPSVKR